MTDAGSFVQMCGKLFHSECLYQYPFQYIYISILCVAPVKN